jgi:hypothetical protein
MNRDDIIRMAREAGLTVGTNISGVMLVGSPSTPGIAHIDIDEMQRFAVLVAAAERNKLAQWMVSLGYATGHGDTMEDLLEELEWQVTESWSKVVVASVEAEREACAQIAFNAKTYIEAAAAIRSRGEK